MNIMINTKTMNMIENNDNDEHDDDDDEADYIHIYTIQHNALDQ